MTLMQDFRQLGLVTSDSHAGFQAVRTMLLVTLMQDFRRLGTVSLV